MLLAELKRIIQHDGKKNARLKAIDTWIWNI